MLTFFIILYLIGLVVSTVIGITLYQCAYRHNDGSFLSVLVSIGLIAVYPVTFAFVGGFILVVQISRKMKRGKGKDYL